MPEMNFWRQVIGSIVKPGYYEEFVKRPVSKAILYLLLLTFIATLLFGIQIAFFWNDVVDNMAKNFAKEAPEFVFANGSLAVNAPMPYVIDVKGDGFLVIDTTGKTNESVLQGRKSGVFISKSNITYKKDEMETRTYDLSTIKDVVITKTDALLFIPKLKWFNIAIIVCLFIYEFVANLIAAWVLAVCGWIACKITNFQLQFSSLYKIGLYALTLPLLLELAKNISGMDVMFFKLIFYLIGTFYVAIAINLLRKKNSSSVEEPVE